MKGKKILLTLHPAVYESLKEKADKNLMTVQEVIYDLLRKNVLASKPTKKKKGKPQASFIERFSRKR